MRVNNTEARRRASRENGKKSRGPVTEAGKAASSMNALTHGLTAEAKITPDDRDALRERAAAWAMDLQLATTHECWLVERAAWHSVRLDRLARREMAEISRRRRLASDAYDAAQQRRVIDAMGILPAHPAQAVRLLQTTPLGCDRLRDFWLSLASRLDEADLADPLIADEALCLLGQPAAEPAPPDSPAAAFLDLIEAGRDDDANRPALAAFAQAEADRLADLRDSLNLDDAARAEAINRALFDDSPAGALQLRYESALSRDLHRALAELRRERSDRERNEPDAPEIEAQEELAAELADPLPVADTPAATEVAGPPNSDPSPAPPPPAARVEAAPRNEPDASEVQHSERPAPDAPEPNHGGLAHFRRW